MSSFCSTCLSCDRNLTSICKLRYYNSTINWLKNDNKLFNKVCWECKAMIVKVHNFKLRCLDAQKILKDKQEKIVATKQFPQDWYFQSMSSLGVSVSNTANFLTTYEYEANNIKNWRDFHCIKEENTEEYEEVTIKVERDEENDSEETISVASVRILTDDEDAKLSDEDTKFCIEEAKTCDVPTEFDEINKTDKKKIETERNKNEQLKKFKKKSNYSRKTTKTSALAKIKLVKNPAQINNIEPNKILKQPAHIRAKEPAKNITTKMNASDLAKNTHKHEIITENIDNRREKYKDFVVTKMSYEEMIRCWNINAEERKARKCSFKCRYCYMGYYKQEVLDKHLTNDHNSLNAFKCQICHMTFNRAGKLSIHEEHHYRLYQCVECDYRDHRWNYIIKHIDSVHRVATYYCNHCDDAFLSRPRLTYHHRLVHGEKVTCDVCKKEMPKYFFKRHMDTHKGVKKECPHCGRLFKALNIKHHINSKHLQNQPKEKAYCAECDRYYVNQCSYVQHVKVTHEGRKKRKNFACPTCPRAFICTSNLESHIAMHNNTVLVECDGCGKGYRYKSTLRNHILRKHLKVEKPKKHICPYCHKGFKERITMRTHMRTHTGERPYECSLCGRSFAQRSTMVTHMRGVHKLVKTK